MSISHLLEDFGPVTRGGTISMSDVSLEEQRLEAFEKGYQAGWDDSLKAQDSDARRITSDLEQNLKELSFTYQEAYAHVVQALKPLLQEMVDAVLPEIARGTLGTKVVELVHEVTSRSRGQSMEIVVSPVDSSAITPVLPVIADLDVKVVEETSLGEGQVFLRFADKEREIDFQEVLSEIRRSVTDFFEQPQLETEHGTSVRTA